LYICSRFQTNEIKIKFFRFVDSNEKQSEEETTRNRDEYFLVLDGQQRLTSLYISLKGTWIERKKVKELYFDALSGKEEDDEGVLYGFKFFERDNGLFFVEKERKENKDIIKVWVNVKRIFEIESGRTASIRNFVRKIVDNDSELDKFEDTIFDNINDLYTVLTSQPNINYYPESEENYDRVLDIFVRTNAGGTKLSYSDLLFSKIKLKWNRAREEFLSLKEDINENDNFDFDIDFILKTCLVIFSKKSQDVRYKIENFKDSKILQIKNNWDKIVKAIQITKDLLYDIGIRNKKLLPSHNAIIPIIYYIYKKDIRGIGEFPKGISRDEENKIKKWLYQILLSGVFSGQSDNVLYKAKETIDSVQEDSFPSISLIKAIKSIKSFDLSKEFLEKVKYHSTNSYLVLSMIYSQLNFKPHYKGNLPQQDHIFSINELKGKYKKEEIDNIGNIRFVGEGENNWKKDKPFSIWIKQISQEERRKHLIPEGKWSVDTYQEFLQKRRELIFNEIKNIIQD